MMNSLTKPNQSSLFGLSEVDLKLNSSDNVELIILCHNILVSAQNAVPFKSWTTRMLSLGAYVILKKVSEEMVEFTIAVCWDRSFGVCEECADLIYHILLLFVGYEIRYERLIEVMKTKSEQSDSITSLSCLEKTAFAAYVNNDRNQLESGIAFMIRELYLSVASLTVLCLKVNINTEVNETTISNAVCDVFINIMMLLRYRGLRYQQVANVLNTRCCH
ncbi:MAG: phosphoribosyl-ATP diphosphatase [Candidatus Hodgkinia cicadicola]